MLIIPNKENATNHIGFLLGILAFLSVLAFCDLDPSNPNITRVLAVIVLMAIWWASEAINLSATAIVPIALFPILGIMDSKTVSSHYINSTIFLFIGGFIIAEGMRQWNLHKRMALWIIGLVGNKPTKLILGFMLTSAFLSMWISNTATAIMMIPIGLALINQAQEFLDKDTTIKFGKALMLGIAYGCSTGGIATLVGTPPNLVFSRIYKMEMPNANPIEFGEWMLFALPLSLVLIAVAYLFLTKIFYRIDSKGELDSKLIKKEKQKLGKMSYEEITVLVVFAITAMLWIFRKDLTIGNGENSFTLSGWSGFLPFPKLVDDGTVAIFMGLLLFCIPSRRRNPEDTEKVSRMKILTNKTFSYLHWDIVLLFGGGFAIAAAFKSSGLSIFLGNQLDFLDKLHPYVMVNVITAFVTFLTELTSNTAMTSTTLPIIVSIAKAINVDPLILMLPVTFGASCAFMLPIATPPNAIIFSSGVIKIRDMMKVGLFLNLACIVIISAWTYFFSKFFF